MPPTGNLACASWFQQHSISQFFGTDGTPCILWLVHLQAQLGCLLHIRIMATAPPPPPSKSQSNDDCYPEGFGNVFFSTKYVGWLWWWWWQTINTQLQLAPGTKCYLSPKVGAGKPDHVSQVHIPNQFCQLPNIGIGRAIPSFLFHFSCLLFSAATTIVGHFFSFVPSAKGKWCALTKNHILCRLTSWHTDWWPLSFQRSGCDH